MKYEPVVLGVCFSRNIPFQNKLPTDLFWATFCSKGIKLWMNLTNSKTKSRNSHPREWKRVQGIYQHQPETNLTSTLKLSMQLLLELSKSQVLLCLVFLLEENNSPREYHLRPVIITHRFHTEMFSFKIKRLTCCWKSIATIPKVGPMH